jgi:hypothetical protein
MPISEYVNARRPAASQEGLPHLLCEVPGKGRILGGLPDPGEDPWPETWPRCLPRAWLETMVLTAGRPVPGAEGRTDFRQAMPSLLDRSHVFA